MPIYEYTCSKCQNVFEEWVKSASAPETDSCPCPKCGADSFRIISNTSFLLKGDGWFNTTYPSAKSAGAGTGSQAADSRGAGSDTGTNKADTAADKKTETAKTK